MERLTDDWMPPGLDEGGEYHSRVRFGIQAWLVAWPPAALWTLYNFSLGLWPQGLCTGLMTVMGPFALVMLKRTGRLSPWFELSMLSAVFLYGPGMLTQTPIAETQLFFASIIPLTAGFLFGWRSAALWTGLTVLASVASLLLGHAGYSLPYEDPDPLLSKSLNIVSALTMAAAFASRFFAVRKASFERVEEANRARSLFFAAVSHEIRTPMNGVLGMTQLMLHDTPDPVARERLEAIVRNGQFLVSLLDDLLDLARLETRKFVLDARPFELQRLCDDVARLFEAQGREKGVEVRAEVDAAVPAWVLGDDLRLRQVLFNLVSNGLKFTPAGRVTLAVRAGERLAFSVEDTGVGISREVLPRLFTFFSQGDATTARRYGGTGLGLALSRQLVALMGGELAVESEEGKGTRFSFSLALPSAQPPAETPAPPPRLGRVLVVDDNPVNLHVAASLVRKAGFEVDTAASGEAAVQAASGADYAAVLMDCQMPDVDGFEATRRIRTLAGPRGQVPVVAVTATFTDDDVRACRASGMHDVVPKPVSFDALLRVLRGR